MVLGQTPTLSVFDSVMNSINTSPYFIGSMMLTMNLGARFLSLEVTKGQEAFLSHPWVRRFLIFVVFFIGTRNVWVAFWMALIVILLLGYLLNENSSLCLFKGGLPGSSCAPKDEVGTRQGISEGFESPSPLTPEENEILQKLLAKQSRGGSGQPKAAEAKPKSLYDTYLNNLEKVKNMF